MCPTALARRLVVLSIVLLLAVAGASAAIKATVDADERVDSPVPHRYIHGVIPDDAKFQLALPDQWNGKLVVFSRGFSGTELTPGAWKTTTLEKGYAFAASDEGWNRLTIAKEPQDSYYESRQRIREPTLDAQQVSLMKSLLTNKNMKLQMNGSNQRNKQKNKKNQQFQN